MPSHMSVRTWHTIFTPNEPSNDRTNEKINKISTIPHSRMIRQTSMPVQHVSLVVSSHRTKMAHSNSVLLHHIYLTQWRSFRHETRSFNLYSIFNFQFFGSTIKYSNGLNVLYVETEQSDTQSHTHPNTLARTWEQMEWNAAYKISITWMLVADAVDVTSQSFGKYVWGLHFVASHTRTKLPIRFELWVCILLHNIIIAVRRIPYSDMDDMGFKAADNTQRQRQRTTTMPMIGANARIQRSGK